MTRTTVTVAAAVLAAAGSFAPSYAASNAADTCFGLPPTIVGTPGQPLTGTPGPDVVVTNGARPVSTLEGDDSVCLTNGSTDVDTGAGQDRVDATAGVGVTADLGGGSDSFVGSAASDLVRAGDEDDARALLPWGVDDIDTGAGPDAVVTGTVIEPAQPNGDSVRLGDDADAATVRGAVPASLDGGAGRDEIAPESRVRGDWVVDARTGVVSLEGVAMPAVSSFSTWTLTGLGWHTLSFRGGPDKDVVDVTRGNGVVKDGPFTARMGPGKDTIYARSRDTGPFNGGPGEDTLLVEAKGTTQKGKSITADLAADRLELSGYAAVRIRSIENLSVSNVDGARVVGDARGNRLSTLGCGNVVLGLAGVDRIDGEADKDCYDAGGLGVTAYGGSANDRLSGGVSRDRLVGGPGRDSADGEAGRDACQAERRMRCEL